MREDREAAEEVGTDGAAGANPASGTETHPTVFGAEAAGVRRTAGASPAQPDAGANPGPSDFPDEWEEKTPTLLHAAGVEMWAVCSDVHVPEHDPRAWDAFLSFVADWRPHGVCINGDFAELSSFSSHGDLVNPGYWREERDAIRRELRRLRRSAGDARIVYNAGNHESRLERSQGATNPAVVGSDTLPEQLCLADLDIEWRREGLPLRLGSLRVVHGKWAPINAAKKHLEKLGSCLVGHVHRPGMHAGGYDHKTQIGWVAPCLRDLDANYLRGYDAASGWAHGFAVAHVWPDETFNCELIVMTPERRFAYGGRVYG